MKFHTKIDQDAACVQAGHSVSCAYNELIDIHTPLLHLNFKFSFEISISWVQINGKFHSFVGLCGYFFFLGERKPVIKDMQSRGTMKYDKSRNRKPAFRA